MSQDKLAAMLALADEEVQATGVDMNEATKGGGGARLLPEGYAFGRLVEYVEFGMQPQEYQGQAKDPALEFSLGFALWGEGYQNDDGSPYIVRTFSMAMSQNEKSRSFKLFRALNWKGSKKHFAQILSEPFLVKIKHVAKSKTDATVVSRIDLDGFLPPLDPVSKQPYPIPEAPAELYRLFLWNRPTKEAWDALFIEGEYEDKSKNRIQEIILGALDFQGSPLQLLLAGEVPALPALPTAPAVAAVGAVAAPVVPTVTQAPVVPVQAVPEAPVAPAPEVPKAAPKPKVAKAPVAPAVPAPIVPPVLPA